MKPAKAADRLIARYLKQQLRGDLTSAAHGWMQAQVRFPNDARIPFFAALLAYVAKDIDLAVDLMRHSITIEPKAADAHYNLGKFLEEKRAPDEAMDCYIAALEADPNHPQALNNLGGLFLGGGDPEAAEQCYSKALAVDTQNPDALYNRSFLKLLKGDLAGGFTDYEARWRCHGFMVEYRRPEIMDHHPRWTGEPLNGKRLLLMAEQGFGDTIQFWRYVPLLLGRVGPFVAEVQTQLVDLLRHNTDPAITIIPRGEALPKFDTWAGTMSLPALFGGKIPNSTFPYLRADGREGTSTYGMRRVGLCWAGSTSHKNDHNRSLPFAQVQTFANVPGVEWHSLQVGDREQEASQAPWITKAGDKWQTFGASARFVSGLDAVVTCDSAVAHLSGALGVRLHVMLPPAPDFRWQLHRKDSPWYPTMTLHRGTRPQQWGDVVQNVSAALEAK